MTGYFFIGDLLGFGSIVRNSLDNELLVRINRWTSMVDSLARTHRIENVQLISDTVFAMAPSTSESLGMLLRFSRELLQQGVSSSLPIRGAITHGDFEWGRLTFGKAVIDGHDLEVNQNWVGVACASDLPRADDHWGINSLIAYPAPMKNGAITIRPVVDWNVPAARDLARLLSAEGLTRAGEALHWGFAEKLNNTTQFSTYKAIARRDDRFPKSFLGLSSMEAIERDVLDRYLGRA